MRKPLAISLVILLISLSVLSACSTSTPAPASPPSATPAAPTSSPSVAPKPATPSSTASPSPSAASGQTINLIFSTWTPGLSADTERCQTWIQKVEEASKGRVKFQFYTSGALGGAVQHYDLAVNGVADVTFYSFASSMGRFPLYDALQYPFIITSADAGTYAVQKVYHEFPEMQQQTGQVKVLALAINDPFNIYTTKRARLIKTIDDFKGLKIRTSGPESATIAALGGTPVGIVDMGEVYMGLDKGIVDGIAMNFQGLKSFRFSEVLQYYTVWDGPSIRSIPWGIFMNLEKWKSLPPDIQKIMVQDFGIDGDWFGPYASQVCDRWASEGKQMAQKANGTFYNLPADELAKWQQKVAPITQQNIKDLEAKGIPGQKFIDRLVQLVKEYDQKNPPK